MITAEDRDRIAAAVDRLIAFLDATEGPDGESDGCEDPIIDGTGARWSDPAIAFDDEAEPSLGWTNPSPDYSPGQLGATDDGEDATMDAEPDVDIEPACSGHTPDGGVLGGGPVVALAGAMVHA